MMKFVILASFLIGAYATASIRPIFTSTHNVGRIVGGEAAEINEVPWQVAALHDSAHIGVYYQKCGGSIISSTVVITAAHCVNGTLPFRWRVRAGSKYSNSGGHIMSVSKLVANERYSNKYDYDIAILWLDSPLYLDGITARAIALPNQGDAVEDGTLALASGWGSTSQDDELSTSLFKVTIPIVNQEKCAATYGGLFPVTARMICAGNFDAGAQDVCRGDFGGPLVVGNVLVGVTSYRIGCTQKAYPGVSVRVSSMMDWINEKLK